MINMVYLDKTFCASPNCTNKCGRMMTQEEQDMLDYLYSTDDWAPPVAYGLFCENNHDRLQEPGG